jgi:hypothetical protein
MAAIEAISRRLLRSGDAAMERAGSPFVKAGRRFEPPHREVAMKPMLLGSFVAVLTLVSPAGTAFAMSNNFFCGTDPSGDFCVCSGAADCRHMRTSGMCDGGMRCDANGCACVTSLVKGKGGITRIPSGTLLGNPGGNGNSWQKVPVRPLRPKFPVKPILPAPK